MEILKKMWVGVFFWTQCILTLYNPAAMLQYQINHSFIHLVMKYPIICCDRLTLYSTNSLLSAYTKHKSEWNRPMLFVDFGLWHICVAYIGCRFCQWPPLLIRNHRTDNHIYIYIYISLYLSNLLLLREARTCVSKYVKLYTAQINHKCHKCAERHGLKTRWRISRRFQMLVDSVESSQR